MTTGPAEILSSAFAARQRRNKQYSLRSFARDLQIHPGTLSCIIAGKRGLPKHTVAKIAKALNLSPVASRALAINPKENSVAVTSDRKQLEDNERYFEIVSEWEHFAILSLMDTPDFRADHHWIATRLGIGPLRSEVAVHRLMAAAFIKIEPESGQWTKSFPHLDTTDGIRSVALRKAHEEELDLAKEKLLEIDQESRDFTSMTMACNPKTLPALRELIRRFRSEAEFIAEEESPSEVYQLCVQLFPLTQIPKKQGE